MAIVGIFGKPGHPRVRDLAVRLARTAVAGGHEVLIEEALPDGVAPAVRRPSQEVARAAGVAVVLGGDGTMIRAVRLLDDREIPVFGVNLGSLGFLTEFTEEEAEAQFLRVLAGEYTTTPRLRLQAELRRPSAPVRARVLNDVVISKGVISRIIDIRTEIDDVVVTTFRADGLIVSTPTGSTAYSMAAGGPILMPGTGALLVTPICPHMLTMRPLVVGGASRIRLSVLTESADMYVTFDGQQAEAIRPGDTLDISCAPGRLLLVSPPRDPYQILRARLKWGQR